MTDQDLTAFLFPEEWSFWDADYWRSGLDDAWASFFKTFVRYCSQEGLKPLTIGKDELEVAYRAMLQEFYDISYLEGHKNYDMTFDFQGGALFLNKAAVVVIEHVLLHFNLDDPDALSERFSKALSDICDATHETASESVIELKDELLQSSTPFARMILSHFDAL